MRRANVRLIYEQIEAARAYLRSGSLLCRLALILLDNAAELMMHRELEDQFAREDKWSPRWEPARTEWLQAGLGPKYTPEERKGAEREFEPKTQILCIRPGRISTEDRLTLNACHRLRCEAFHRGVLRQTILEQVARLLYLTVVELTVKLPFRSLTLPGPRPDTEDAKFLRRFGIAHAHTLATDDGQRQLANGLLAGVDFDPSSFLSALSDDLVERIDDTLRGLETVGETTDCARIDRMRADGVSKSLTHSAALRPSRWRSAAKSTHFDQPLNVDARAAMAAWEQRKQIKDYKRAYPRRIYEAHAASIGDLRESVLVDHISQLYSTLERAQDVGRRIVANTYAGDGPRDFALLLVIALNQALILDMRLTEQKKHLVELDWSVLNRTRFPWTPQGLNP